MSDLLPPSPQRRPWLQFSLRSLFVLTLVVAAYFAGVLSQRPALERLQVEAVTQRSIAEKNRQQALAVLDQMLQQVQADLSTADETQALREELLKSGLEYAQELESTPP